MRKSLERILNHRKKYYSQAGEDGVLEYILSQLPERDRWSVEFGAWDGKYLSNTFHFISAHNYKGVLIEGEKDRCELLAKNMEPYGAICINKFVDSQGENSLDKILSSTPIPRDFDLLSIDIDSIDYQVWESLKNYQPKVVIIELNIRDKPEVDRINKPGSPYEWGVSGSSIKSLNDLAILKQYSLVANVSCNAIFVKNTYFNIFHDQPLTPREAFLYEGHSFTELNAEERRHLGILKTSKKLLQQIFQKRVSR